jgi:hypothetical protein
MIWNSFLFDKHYKWLSYNLWFTYIQFYKVIFFFDFTLKLNTKMLNYYYRRNFIFTSKKYKQFKLTKTKPRFSYYTDLYCLEFFDQLLLLNLYFFTTLQFYKKKHYLKKKNIKNLFIWDDLNGEHHEQYNSSDISKKDSHVFNTFF